MKLVLLVIFFVSTVMETTQMTIPLTASLLTAGALLLGRDSAMVLFFGGLLLDVFSLRYLGQSSIYFLLVGMVAGRYQRKFFSGNASYAMIILFASTAGYQWINTQHVDIRAVGISVAIALAFLWIVNRTGMSDWQKGKGLRL